MKLLSAVFLTAVLITSSKAEVAPAAVQPCPIAIPQIWTHGFVQSNYDTDPWHSYLKVKITNVTGKSITAIRLGVAFTDAFGVQTLSVFEHGSDDLIKSSKSQWLEWADGVEAGNGMRLTGAIVWMQKVLFADGSMLVDDGTHTCGAMVGPQRLENVFYREPKAKKSK